MTEPGDGDFGPEEIQRIYGLLGPALLAYGHSILGDRPAAEDVLHQVFLKLLSGRIAMPEDPRPYLFRAVRNAALNLRRDAAREAGRRLDAVFEPPRELRSAGALLDSALAGLPDEQREVVVLKVWGELTLQEAAEVLGISPNTAASRYRYALEKLRERLAPFLGG